MIYDILLYDLLSIIHYIIIIQAELHGTGSCSLRHN